MRQADWIKVEDRLPEAKYGIGRDCKGLSEYVLIVYLLDKTSTEYVTDVAIYDHQSQRWYDKYDNIIDQVEYWRTIVPPKEKTIIK